MNPEFKYLIPMAIMTGIAIGFLSFKAEAGDCMVVPVQIEPPVTVRTMR